MNSQAKLMRNSGLDSLRSLMICCVIALHAAMTYMAYVPQWWYVIDTRQSFVFTVLVVFLDTFPMSVLFFLAGYFVPISLEKKGLFRFITGKVIHLGIPWLCGMLCVVPFLAWASMHSVGLKHLTFYEIWNNFLFGPFYQQGHYWFLGVLLCFMVLYALFQKPLLKAFALFCHVIPKHAVPQCFAIASPFNPLLITFIIGTLGFAVSVSILMPMDHWLNVQKILYFQPARILNYVALFLLGIHAKTKNWFTLEGWIPNISFWLFSSSLSIVLWLLWFFSPLSASLKDNQNVIYALCSSVLYNASAISITILLTTCFTKFSHRLPHFLTLIAPQTYGIYWLHQIILLPLLALFSYVPLPAGILWGIAIIATVLISYKLTEKAKNRFSFIKRVI